MMSEEVVPNDPRTTADNEEEGEEMRQEAIERRKERRKRQRTTRNGRRASEPMGMELNDSTGSLGLGLSFNITVPIDQTDIVEGETSGPASHNLPVIATDVDKNEISNPTDTIYVQQQSGFRPGARHKMLEILEQRRKLEAENEESRDMGLEGSMKAAFMFHGAFHTIGLVLQGLISGFSLCQCLFVVFSTPPWNMDMERFAKDYQIVSLPIHIGFYATITICTVSSFDRYDPGESFLRALWRGLTFQSGAWCTVLYLIALAFSLSSFPAEYTISLYAKSTHPLPPIDEQIFWVKVCSTGRAVCTGLAWIIVSLRPNTDLLLKRLESAQKALQIESNKAEVMEKIDAVIQR